MSYSEYWDLFYDAQKKECPYRAFTFDVVNSRNQIEYINDHKKFLEFVLYVYSCLENKEKSTNIKILLNDRYNHKCNLTQKNNLKLNDCNPIILGDMATYFVYNNSITTTRMIEIFKTGLEKFNISYPFHFATGIYETNIFAQGGTKLYKGYMPQMLEYISKKRTIIIENTNKEINI